MFVLSIIIWDEMIKERLWHRCAKLETSFAGTLKVFSRSFPLSNPSCDIKLEKCTDFYKIAVILVLPISWRGRALIVSFLFRIAWYFLTDWSRQKDLKYETMVKHTKLMSISANLWADIVKLCPNKTNYDYEKGSRRHSL